MNLQEMIGATFRLAAASCASGVRMTNHEKDVSVLVIYYVQSIIAGKPGFLCEQQHCALYPAQPRF